MSNQSPCPKKKFPVSYAIFSDWTASSVTHQSVDDTVVITTKGAFKDGPEMSVEQKIGNSGIDITYTVKDNSGRGAYGYLGFAASLTAQIDTI